MSAMFIGFTAFLLVDVNAAPAKVYQYDDAACTVGRALLSTHSTIEKISDGSTCFKGIAYGNPNSEHDKCYQAGEVIVRTLYEQSDCHMDKPTWRSRVINITKATYQKYLNKECFTMLGGSGQVGDRYWKLEAGDPAVPDCMESYMQSITPATTAPTTKGPSMAPTSVAPTGKVLTPTVVKGNIKFGVSMNATEAASFVKDAKVVLGVETGIAKQLKLAKMSWVKATLSVVTARRLGAAANATANINVDFVITVPATATSAPSASVLEASLQKTDQASKDQWKATLTTEIKKAAPAHANLKVTVSSIAHTPVTTPAPGNKTKLSPSIRASLPHLAGFVVMVAAALF